MEVIAVDARKKKKPFKILCIDGGGIKGLYSAKVLAKFEEVFQCRISDHFDLICGTSTGGIIALGISLGIPMCQICKFYEEHGPKIFCEQNKKSKLGRLKLIYKQTIKKGKYSNTHLRKALYEVFGDETLSNSKNLLCIPAYNITSARPRVFKKDYGNYTEDNKLKYVDVALATSAAPTYFPIKKIGEHYYIDGGVWANNPTLVGLTEFIINFAPTSSYNRVDVLSIGSIAKPLNELCDKTERSFLDWKDTLFDTFTVGQSYNVDFLMQKLQNVFKIPINYVRVKHNALSVAQLSAIEMDKADNTALNVLKAVGEDTGIMYKDNPVVKDMFSTNKSI